MRIIAIALMLFVAGCGTPTRTGDDATRDLLIGSWQSTQNDTRAEVTIAENGTFNGLVTQGGRKVWSFDGNWTLSDREFTWEYVNSAPPLQEEEKLDVSTIVALTNDEVVFQDQSGNPSKYLRISP